MGVNPGGTWPPIGGGVPGTGAPPGMGSVGGDMPSGPNDRIDPMALMAMAKLARGTKARRVTRAKSKSKARRK